MYTLDRQDPSKLRVRVKSWWFFTILSVIAIVCVSCSSAPQQTSSSRGRTVQSPRVTVAAGLPLTDSAPPQLDVTPTILASTPLRVPAIATPRVLQTTTIDDSAHGTGLDQFNYVGSGWKYYVGHGCSGTPDCAYNDSNSWDNTTGDYMTFTFTGVQIKFYGVLDTLHGIGAISLEGGSETMIDYYSAKRLGDQLMWTSPMLPASTHIFELCVTGMKNPSSTDYYVAVDRVDILS